MDLPADLFSGFFFAYKALCLKWSVGLKQLMTGVKTYRRQHHDLASNSPLKAKPATSAIAGFLSSRVPHWIWIFVRGWCN